MYTAVFRLIKFISRTNSSLISSVHRFTSVFHKKRMIFVNHLFVLLKYFGISADEKANRSPTQKLLLFILCSFPMMFILGPNILYFILSYKSEDVLGITDLAYTIFMFSGIWNSYLIMAIRQGNLRELLNELKSFVAKSEYRLPNLNSPSTFAAFIF